MAFEFKLPDIGEGVVEGEIVSWLVSKGDDVAEDQPLVEVMTDKATVEIPSPKAGKVKELGADEGDVVKVGAVLVTLETDGDAGGDSDADEEADEDAEKDEKKERKAEKKAEKKKEKERDAQEKKKEKPREKREEKPAAAKRDEPRGPRPAPESPARAREKGKVLASPATRKLARELGVDLSDVHGTGPRGRITTSDVEKASREPARPVAAPSAPASRAPAERAPSEPLLAIPHRDVGPSEQQEERKPLRGLRRVISQRMIESKTTAAHFAYVDECDVTALVELRERLKPEAARYGVKLTYLPFILKALVPALREHPLLNASLDAENEEIVFKKYYNIGVAADTEQGLTVPVVHDVDRKNILEISAEIVELVNAARSQRLSREQVSGGTFTVTSTGNIGGLFATPIINVPEVAILGVPKIKKRPVVDEETGAIVVRDMLYLALSLDHRVVDGAVGARFMNTLIGYLKDPSRILLELV